MNKHTDFLYPGLTYQMRGAIFAVWKELGPAFKETVYQKALEREFSKKVIPFVSQKQIDILYDNKKNRGV
jgi:GxxExxY protein